jgi:hypothetical protein
VRSCGGLIPIYWWTKDPRIALAATPILNGRTFNRRWSMQRGWRKNAWWRVKALSCVFWPTELDAGAIVVVEDQRIRIRRLPIGT